MKSVNNVLVRVIWPGDEIAEWWRYCVRSCHCKAAWTVLSSWVERWGHRSPRAAELV